MDICIVTQKVSPYDIQSESVPEDSETVRKRVMLAHEVQKKRFRGSKILFNSQMGNREIEQFCKLGPDESKLMNTLAKRHDMSARTYYRILKVARTIADLAGQQDITEDALCEAVRMKISF